MNALVILNTLILLFLVAKPYIKRKRPPTREDFEQAMLNASGAVQEAMQWIDIEKAARLPKPIHHPKVEGPTTAKVTSTIGYWRVKDDSKAEPFLAAWYEKDTTTEGGGFSPGDSDLEAEPTIISADTYVDLVGRKIPGAAFRSRYEPAEAVMEVARLKLRSPLHNSTLITANRRKDDGLKLTPEEEQKLAEEFELVPNPPSITRALNDAGLKAEIPKP